MQTLRSCCCLRSHLGTLPRTSSHRSLGNSSARKAFQNRPEGNLGSLDGIFSPENRTRCQEAFLKPPSDSEEFKVRKRAGKKEGKAYSVLIPLVHYGGVPSILFEVRSNLMKGHRGEVCFPGGKIEAGESPLESALRETKEEIDLDPSCVEIWGSMSSIYARNLVDRITPVVGYVKSDYSQLVLKPHAPEVDRIMIRSIASLVEPCELGYTQFRISDKAGYSIPIFCKSEFPRIWGLTGMILHETLKIVATDAYKSKMKFVRPPW